MRKRKNAVRDRVQGRKIALPSPCEQGPVAPVSRPDLDRRTFLRTFTGVTAAGLVAGVPNIARVVDTANAQSHAADMGPEESHDRRLEAYNRRLAVAQAHRDRPLPDFPTNDDEAAYPNKIASYTKGLPHDERGEVERPAYAAFLKALATGQHAAFEVIPLGGRAKFANPQAAYAFELEGPDPHQFGMNAPPTFRSAETAGEMVELYWQALTRDVPFAEYEAHPLTVAAAADLSRCTDFRGPKLGKR